MTDTEVGPRLLYAGHYKRQGLAAGYNMPAMVVEIPPMRLTMRFDGEMYDIPLPWTYYTISIRESPYDKTPVGRVCSLFGRPEQWRAMSDPLYFLPLPNLYPSLTFCNNDVTLTHLKDQDATVLTVATINQFWDASFSYTRHESNQAVWDKMTSLSKSFADKHKNYRRAPGDHTCFAWWESLSIEEICEFPFGKVVITTLEKWAMNPSFGYQHYGQTVR